MIENKKFWSQNYEGMPEGLTLAEMEYSGEQIINDAKSLRDTLRKELDGNPDLSPQLIFSNVLELNTLAIFLAEREGITSFRSDFNPGAYNLYADKLNQGLLQQKKLFKRIYYNSIDNNRKNRGVQIKQ